MIVCLRQSAKCGSFPCSRCGTVANFDLELFESPTCDDDLTRDRTDDNDADNLIMPATGATKGMRQRDGEDIVPSACDENTC